MTELWVSAGIEINQGQSVREVREALASLQKVTVAEEGCIRFEVLQHNDNPGRFTLWEQWVDEAALKSHFKAQHTLDYLAKEYTRVDYIEKLDAVALMSR